MSQGLNHLKVEKENRYHWSQRGQQTASDRLLCLPRIRNGTLVKSYFSGGYLHVGYSSYQIYANNSVGGPYPPLPPSKEDIQHYAIRFHLEAFSNLKHTFPCQSKLASEPL